MNSVEKIDDIAFLLGIQTLSLDAWELDLSLHNIVSPAMAWRYQVLPLFFQERDLVLALVDPFDAASLAALRFALDYDICQIVAPSARVRELLERYCKKRKNSVETPEATVDAPFVVDYVNQLLDEAIHLQASDLHLEPLEMACTLRYRVDGTLHEKPLLSKKLALAVISRIKIMANLDIAEQRLPQDGRLENVQGTSSVVFRVATLPTQFGESLVLRLLDHRVMHLTMKTLGLPSALQETLQALLQQPHGLFVVTGPTGSGKTTTLYACLQEINHESLKIITVEDPVEYEIEGVLQISINEATGLTFPRTLRSLLRHDPDVIMIGETRDALTAQMALQASLTGHRIFTTLHTNDATGAVTRLIDMGCDPLILGTTLRGVLAQRLLRKICSDCRVSYQPDKNLLSQLGIEASENELSFYYGHGCLACNQTGYQGRAAIFELLLMNDRLQLLIERRSEDLLLRKKAVEQGMIPLRVEGLRLLREGITTAEEVLRWT